MPKRFVFPEKGRVELQEFDLPEVGPADIQVRTLYSRMRFGTETTILHQKYAPGTHYDRIFSFPQLKTGVQAIAEVESIGAEVKDFQDGDRIYMHTAHIRYCGRHFVHRFPTTSISSRPAGADWPRRHIRPPGRVDSNPGDPC